MSFLLRISLLFHDLNHVKFTSLFPSESEFFCGFSLYFSVVSDFTLEYDNPVLESTVYTNDYAGKLMILVQPKELDYLLSLLPDQLKHIIYQLSSEIIHDYHPLLNPPLLWYVTLYINMSLIMCLSLLTPNLWQTSQKLQFHILINKLL